MLCKLAFQDMHAFATQCCAMHSSAVINALFQRSHCIKMC